MECDKTYDCCLEQEEVDIEGSIMGEGVTFTVNYIGNSFRTVTWAIEINFVLLFLGCIEIFTSMKMLDFQNRSLVARECINRVCDAANLKVSPKKRRVEKRVEKW